MNRAPAYETAMAVGRYVRKKIMAVQRQLQNGNASLARATLARWRKLSSQDGASLFMVGDEVLYGWPVEELGYPDDNTRAVNAVCAALELYALHQQSKSYPVAVFESKESGPTRRFTRACREAQFDLEHANGFKSRLASVEVATDFDGVVVNVRGLIRLLRSAKDSKGESRQLLFDYEVLARDLFLMQLGDATRKRVLTSWASDYFCATQESDGDESSKA